jgi:hypothetical protein
MIINAQGIAVIALALKMENLPGGIVSATAVLSLILLTSISEFRLRRSRI